MSAVLASPAASGSTPVDPVRALQHALYRAAKADPGRRFHSLWDKILRRDVLWRAWVMVRRNDRRNRRLRTDRRSSLLAAPSSSDRERAMDDIERGADSTVGRDWPPASSFVDHPAEHHSDGEQSDPHRARRGVGRDEVRREEHDQHHDAADDRAGELNVDGDSKHRGIRRWPRWFRWGGGRLLGRCPAAAVVALVVSTELLSHLFVPLSVDAVASGHRARVGVLP